MSASTSVSTPEYRRPRGWFRRHIGDPVMRVLLARVRGPGAVLEVDGTRATRRIPIIIWGRDGLDYAVGLFGITPWVRDVRAGRSVRASSSTSAGPSPMLAWYSRRALPDSVLDHQALKVSPGTGIIAFRRTSSSTGRRVQTIGAVKPPIDSATTTMSRRSPRRSTTASAYAAQPALSSSDGSRIAIAS